MLSTRTTRITDLTAPAPYHPKEVAQMNSITTQWTTQNSSAFGMPTCGHASFGASLRGTGVFVGSAGVDSRVRPATSVKGAMGIATAYLPGTSAWRPPTC
ncbi:MAG: hypothetical protein F2667_00090 [Actinobacteria bacterium]|nr:hypothetical protein [Actinomycetota bacterium]